MAFKITRNKLDISEDHLKDWFFSNILGLPGDSQPIISEHMFQQIRTIYAKKKKKKKKKRKKKKWNNELHQIASKYIYSFKKVADTFKIWNSTFAV